MHLDCISSLILRLRTFTHFPTTLPPCKQGGDFTRWFSTSLHTYTGLRPDARIIVASRIGWTFLPRAINARGINRVGHYPVMPPCIHPSLRIIMISVTVVQQGGECDDAGRLIRVAQSVKPSNQHGEEIEDSCGGLRRNAQASRMITRSSMPETGPANYLASTVVTTQEVVSELRRGSRRTGNYPSGRGVSVSRTKEIYSPWSKIGLPYRRCR